MDTPSTFDTLANWVDHAITPLESDDPHPNTLDPRPTPAEVIDLDAEVASLTAKLSNLTVRRSQLLASRALINNVPLELLSRVFELAVHVTPSLLPTLSLVSRTWRDIVLSTPSLHTYIRFDGCLGFHGGNDDTRTTSEIFLDQIKRQLARSHDAKILIDIHFGRFNGLIDVPLIMKELEPHLHRCFSFKASLPDWDFLGAAKNHASLLGPVLEQLHLHIESSESEDQSPFSFLTAPCPKLHTITLEHAPLACIRGPITPPLPPTTDLLSADEPTQSTTMHPSLRHLHLIHYQDQSNTLSSSRNVIPFASLLSSLADMPSLVSLHIHSAVFILVGTEDIFLPEPKKLKMPNLESLTFNLVDTTNIELFLNNVDCERLKMLRIQMEGAGGAEDSLGFLMRACEARPGRYTALYPVATIPHLPLYAQTPFPALRYLDLRAISTTGPALYPFIRVLHNLPNLTALAISNPPSGFFGGRIWELLSAPSRPQDLPPLHSPPVVVVGGSGSGSSDASQKNKQEWIVPALKALIIQYGKDVSGHEILKLVRERKNASIASRLQGAHARLGSARSVVVPVDGDDGLPRPGEPPMLPEEEADVAEISYLKIAGCYGLDRESDIVDELKRLVKKAIL